MRGRTSALTGPGPFSFSSPLCWRLACWVLARRLHYGRGHGAYVEPVNVLLDHEQGHEILHRHLF
jgi:hypothetical protein